MTYTPPPLLSQEPEPEILNPITNLPERDPLYRYAIEKGYWYKTRWGKLKPDWYKIQKEAWPHWKIPRYFGFTEEEKQTYYKLAAEAFYPLRSVGYLLGFQYPSAGVKFVVDYRIPVYRISRFLYVFSGDIVRAVAACQIDPEDVIAQRCLETQGKRWDREKSRHGKGKAQGDALPYKGRVPEAEKRSTSQLPHQARTDG